MNISDDESDGDGLEVTDWNSTAHQLRPPIFWHLTTPSHMLLHNAFIGKGIVYSVSAVRAMPGLENAVSPYGLLAMQSKKEKRWEEIRLRSDPNLPSRAHAMFLLPSPEIVEIVRSTWFKNEVRIPVEARVAKHATMHVADARLLDCTENQWEANAEAYWRGAMTVDPVPEILVNGVVYFPGWASPPFGLMR